MTIELLHVLVSYIVCGDRIEARVRTYADGHAVEEASLVFSQTDLPAKWDEADILALTGCDHWITDTAGALLATDILTPTLKSAVRFNSTSAPTGTLLAKLVTSKQPQVPGPI